MILELKNNYNTLMHTYMSIKKSHLLFLWIMLMSISGLAINKTQSKKIVYNGITNITSGYTTSLTDPGQGNNAVLQSRVYRFNLAVEYYREFVSAAYDADITVNFQFIDPVTSTVLYIQDQQMLVHYDVNNPTGNSKDIHSINFPEYIDAAKVTITLTSVKIVTNGVTTNNFPKNLYLDCYMDNHYIYNFSALANETFVINNHRKLSLDATCSDNQFEFNWAANITVGALLLEPEYFELEWTFVNDYAFTPSNSAVVGTKATNLLNFDFANNATRVSVGGLGNKYIISNVFDRGYLLYRVRGVGRSVADPTKLIYTNWSLPDKGLVSSYFVSAALTLKNCIQVSDHSQLLNWNYTSTFAEEGKRKEIINYFDGSLRDRQAVTLTKNDFEFAATNNSNNNNKAIVGETFYDHIGRPAVTALPVPVPIAAFTCADKGVGNALKYYKNFNITDIVTTTKFSRDDFDLDVTAAPGVPTSKGLKTSTGASNYYSTANLDKDKEDFANIPDALKFPYIQKEYTPDNTGRVQREGGVGYDYQLNSGKETKHFYGQPTQLELDRMFGSEVGDASRYKKQMSIDGNGQASVTYVDQTGKTIATSLVGNNPANLDAVTVLATDPSALALTTVTPDLLNKDANNKSTSNVINIDGDAIVFNSNYLVAAAGNHTFAYDLKGVNFTEVCSATNFCLDCKYDLEVKVLDIKGVNMLAGCAVNTAAGGFTLTNGVYSYTAACPTPPAMASQYFTTATSCVVNLPVGSYTIVKTLRVNKAQREVALANYLAGTCVKKLTDFTQPIPDPCSETYGCTECLAEIGTKADFINNGGTELEYLWKLEDCDELCKPESWCKNGYQMMLFDMNPNGGQYAQHTLDGVLNTANFPLSVLNVDNDLPQNYDLNFVPNKLNTANYRYPKYVINGAVYNEYFDEHGKVDRVDIEPNATAVNGYLPLITATAAIYTDPISLQKSVSPKDLADVKDFIKFFKESWARSLIVYHPEYPYYEACQVYSKIVPTATISSDMYDDELLNTETYADAVTKQFLVNNTGVTNNNVVVGFLDGIAASPLRKDPIAVNDNLYRYDPKNVPYTFATLGTAPNTLNDILKDKFNNYKVIDGVTMSMADMAAYTARYGTKYAVTLPIAPNNPLSNSKNEFGKDIAALTSGANPVLLAIMAKIKNKEWSLLKTFYAVEKRKLQQSLIDEYARQFVNNFSSNLSIGDENYAPVRSILPFMRFPFFYASIIASMADPNNTYYKLQSPTSIYHYKKYAKKNKRFGANVPDGPDEDLSEEDLTELENANDYQAYLQSGLCPMGNHVVGLLGDMANNGLLENSTASTIIMNDMSYFPGLTKKIYQALNLKFNISSSNYNVYQWHISPTVTTSASPLLTSKTLKIVNSNNAANFVTITLANAPVVTTNIMTTNFTGWANVKSFRNMTITSAPTASLVTFEIYAEQWPVISSLNAGVNSQQAVFSKIIGSIDLNLADCNFKEVCTPNKLSKDLLNLMNTLLVNDNDNSTNNNDLETKGSFGTSPALYIAGPSSYNGMPGGNIFNEVYGPLITPEIANVLGTSMNIFTPISTVDDLEWTAYAATSSIQKFRITNTNLAIDKVLNIAFKNGANPINDIQIYLAANPNKTVYFSKLKPKYQSNFSVSLVNSDGKTIKVYDGEVYTSNTANTIKVGVSLGKCGTPKPMYCQGDAYQLYDEATQNFTFMFAKPTFSSVSNLVDFWSFTSNKELLGGTYSHFSGSSVSFANISAFNTNIAYYDFSPRSPNQNTATCRLTARRSVGQGTAIQSNNYIKMTTPLKVYGKPDANGNYYQLWAMANWSNSGTGAILFTDSIIFETCFPMKPCFPCALTSTSACNTCGARIANTTTSSAEETLVIGKTSLSAANEIKVKPLIDQITFVKDNLTDSLKVVNKFQPSETRHNFVTENASNQSNLNLVPSIVSRYLIYPFPNQFNTTFVSYDATNMVYYSNGIGTYHPYGECGYDPALTNSKFLVLENLQQCNISSTPTVTSNSASGWSCSGLFDYDSQCECKIDNYLNFLNRYTLLKYGGQKPQPNDFFFTHSNNWGGQRVDYLNMNNFYVGGLNLCTGCMDDYITYLSDFVEPSHPNYLKNFKSFENFCVLSSDNKCKITYVSYKELVTSLNTYLAANSIPIISAVIESNFVSSYCNCYEKYEAFVNAVISGTQIGSTASYKIEDICSGFMTVPCTPTAPLTEQPFFYVESSVEPCEAYQTELNNSNALGEYNQYLAGVKAKFIREYNAKCLASVTENFTVSYSDKQFQYTLYYYDQAGNLIKTVPPEGVRLASTNTSTSPDEVLIKADRLNGTHWFTMKHVMTTNYEYNSLNQLVRQTMPDHDNITIWENSNTNGLDSRLNITSSHFISSTKGYLTGYIPGATAAANRGLMYTTDDAGKSWQLVNNMMAADLNKVFMADANTGYAVGNRGLVLKTIDGGASWDLITLNTTANLNDCYFINATQGIIVGDGPLCISTVNGGTSFTTLTVPATVTGTIRSISFENTGLGKFYFCSTNKIFTSVVSNATTLAMTFTDVSKISGLDFNTVSSTVDFASSFAAGKDGLIAKTGTSYGAAWQVISSNTTANILDLQMFNDNIGVAILEDPTTPGLGYLYKSTDACLNWIKITTEKFKKLHFYYFDRLNFSSASGYAYSDTKLYPITFSYDILTNNVNVQTQSVSILPAPYYAVYAESGGKTWVNTFKDGYYAFVEVNNNASTTYSFASVPPTSVNKEIIVSNNYAIGIAANGALYNLYLDPTPGNFINYTTTTFVGSATPNITDIDEDECYFYAFDKVTNKLYSTLKTGFGLSSQFTSSLDALSAPVGTLPSVHEVKAIFTKNHKLMVGTNGALYTDLLDIPAVNPNRIISNNNSNNAAKLSAVAAPVCVTTPIIKWQNSTELLTPLILNDIVFSTDGTTKITYVASNNGNIISSTNGINWKHEITGAIQNINALAIEATTNNKGLAVGGNGAIYYLNGSVANTPLLNAGTNSPMFSTSAITFKDVVLDNSGILKDAYAVGTNGALYQVKNYNTSAPTFNSISTATLNASLNSIATIGSAANGWVVVGNNTAIHQVLGTTALAISKVYAPQLNDVHFLDNNNGTVVGNLGFTRLTTDGGISWNRIQPYYSTTNVSDLYAAQTLGAGIAYVAGSKDHAYKIGLNLSTKAVTLSNIRALVAASTNVWKDIVFDANLANGGYMVGSNTATNIALKLISTATSTTPYTVGTTASINTALPIPNTTHVLFVGNSLFLRVNTVAATGTTFVAPTTLKFADNTAVPATSNILDAAFTGSAVLSNGSTDYIGYFTTNNGLVQGFKLNKTTANLYTMSYDANGKTTTDALGLPAIITQPNITTISAVNTGNLFYGGNYTNQTTLNSPSSFSRTTFYDQGKPITKFWYDKLGRLVVSQNPKQYNATIKAYSYTFYDDLGRISEVGEKYENTSPKFSGIFGDFVSGKFNPNVINELNFKAWVNTPLAGNNGVRKDVTKTFYDKQETTLLSGYTQENLRKRVSHTTYEIQDDANNATYTSASHYSYDVHGNVKRLITEIKELGTLFPVNANLNKYKTTDYEYDLLSGKVNKVIYQKGLQDQFMHSYAYDGDNRIIKTETSKDGLLWDQDAKYKYALHGPLARTELGNGVQGLDYAYTLQGWLKGVNSGGLTPQRDMGRDGDNIKTYPRSGYTDINQLVARDAFGFTLGYNTNDYSAISTSWGTKDTRFEADISGSWLAPTANTSKELYNGNIARMVTAIVDPAAVNTPLVLGNTYKYDQLNRITNSFAFNGLTSNLWLAQTGGYNNLYFTNYSYDFNGNILTQARYNGAATPVLFDNLTYKYAYPDGATAIGSKFKPTQNRLYTVADGITNTALMTDDIENQTAYNNNVGNPNAVTANNNYRYDAIGNLIFDKQENIDLIEWTVSGKIRKITFRPGSGKDNLEYVYDPSGNRLIKKKLDPTTSAVKEAQYYMRDASGNVLAIYKYYKNGATNKLDLMEQHVYGSSRLGIINETMDMTTTPAALDGYFISEHFLNKKRFELSNHLGNVLATVSDYKKPNDVNADALVDFYNAQVISSQDYYPFGAPMKERTFSSSGYRYGFNGKENDNEVKGNGNQQDYGMRIYDPRLGRFLSKDYYGNKYPDLSPYSYAVNNPIRMIDVDGDFPGDPFGLTWNQLSGAAISKGVWQEIKTNYPALTNQMQWNLYKQRLGRIFEAAVLNSIGRDKNTTSFNGRIPDAVVETSASKNVYDPKTGRSDITYYWWKEGAFIDAKTTQTEEVPFTDQIKSFIDVLSKNNNAQKSTSAPLAAVGIGQNVNEGAVKNEAAILHLITPAKTKINQEILDYATKKGVMLWHSETEGKIEINKKTKEAEYSLKVGNKKPLNFVKEASVSSGTEGKTVPINFSIK
jgi:RHS repeat-associated protein